MNNQITCQSSDLNDVTGTFTVEIQQVLVDYESLGDQTTIQGTTTFQVTINACSVSSVSLDTANSDALYAGAGLTAYTHTTGYVFSFPAITFSPACAYTLSSMYAKSDGSLVDNTGFTKTL